MSKKLFKNNINNLFITSGVSLHVPLQDRTNVDLAFKDKMGNKVALEYKDSSIIKHNIIDRANQATPYLKDYDKYLIITPDSPNDYDRDHFIQSVNIPEKVEWHGLNELPQIIGITDPLDLNSPEIMDYLQDAAITTRLDTYSYGTDPTIFEPTIDNFPKILEYVKNKKELIPDEYRSLIRQFPYKTISSFRSSPKPVQELLKIGEKVPNVIIVLSDIKNFSKLVKVSRPDDLNEIMSKYYFGARELVWKYSGILDKFIGDAVLAVFSYPYPNEDFPLKAIKYSAELISLGEALLKELSDRIDEDIETGTRVGIATGDIWILDIGKDEETEVTFIGDVVNLAARLESNSAVNGILMTKKTKIAIEKYDQMFIRAIAPQQQTLSRDQAKGQLADIKVWQISSATVNDITKKL